MTYTFLNMYKDLKMSGTNFQIISQLVALIVLYKIKKKKRKKKRNIRKEKEFLR